MDVDLKGKMALSPTSDITMLFQRVHQMDVPVYHKIALEDYAINKMNPQQRELAYLRLNQRIERGVLKSAVFTASYQENQEGRELLKNGASDLRTEFDKIRTWGFSAETVASNDKGWSANTGVEIYHDWVNSHRSSRDLLSDEVTASRGLYPDGATMTSLGAFSMHTFDWQKWNLTLGTRFNTFIINVEDETLGATRITPSALVGNIGLLRKLNSSSNLFVSLNTGFRAPNVDDLGTLGIVDFRYETPNFDLKPEHSLQYQIGYKMQTTKVNGEVFLYRNELYNLIERNRIEGDSIEGYPVYQKENVGRSYIQGAEAACNLNLNKAWTVSGSLTYSYGQNVTNNEPVRRIPPLFCRLGLAYEQNHWWINLEWQTAGTQDRLSGGDIDDNRIPAGGTPGWNVFNVNSRHQFEFFEVDLSLRNLFDEDYRFHGSGINAVGRSAILSVRVHI
jgi:outer membrane receptor protein involved in Fe transport